MPEKISLANINFVVNGKPLLKNISFSLSEEEKMIVTGRSGSGKSVLLEISAGLIRPHEGQVFINGSDIREMTRNELLRIRQEMGFVFQKNALICNINSFENIALPLRYHLHLSETEIKKRVMKSMEKLSITHLRQERPEALSISEARRVSIARSLIMNPKLLFLDQPLSGLDPVTAIPIINLIEDLHAQKNLAMLITSHNIQMMKQLRCKIAVLDQGSLIDLHQYKDRKNGDKPEIVSCLEGKI
jgi:phospholipid/cholesterol/gamma-HCH transport system ATP-binding protein